MVRAKRFWMLLTALGLACLAGCDRKHDPLRVGGNTWAGYGPLFLAQNLGLYPERTFKILHFSSAVDVMRAYRNRVIDVAAVTADEALVLAQKDPEQRIILICDYSNGADMILARPPIQSPAELKGRRVGVESGALGAYMLARALQSAEITVGDIVVESRDMLTLPSAYEEGRIDAAVVYEPVASQIKAMGARSIFDSRQIPGEIIDVLITRQSFIDEHPDAIRTLVAAWFKALDRLRADPTEANRQLLTHWRMAADTYPQALSTIQFLDAEENRRALTGRNGPLVDQLRRLQAVMLDQRLLTLPVEVEQLPNATLLPPPVGERGRD